MKARHIKQPNQFDWMIYCPACECGHGLAVGRKEGPSWTFNGDQKNPTFGPSLKVTTGMDGKDVCHSQITNGKIYYYPDSTHTMAGQTVDLPDF